MRHPAGTLLLTSSSSSYCSSCSASSISGPPPAIPAPEAASFAFHRLWTGVYIGPTAGPICLQIPMRSNDNMSSPPPAAST